MKWFFILLSTIIYFSCQSKTESQGTLENPNREESAEKVHHSDKSLTDWKQGSLPVFGTLTTDDREVIQDHEYGFGDCWGIISKYSSEERPLVIDSLFCGEYGYTYTSYLLNPRDGQVEVIGNRSFQSTTDDNGNNLFLVEEHIVDLSKEPAISLMRKDTLSKYQTDFTIKKPFYKEVIIDNLDYQKKVQKQYEDTWLRTLED